MGNLLQEKCDSEVELFGPLESVPSSRWIRLSYTHHQLFLIQHQNNHLFDATQYQCYGELLLLHQTIAVG